MSVQIQWLSLADPVCASFPVPSDCRAKAEAESASAAVMDSQQKELFLKRFGFSETVTEDMLKARVVF